MKNDYDRPVKGRLANGGYIAKRKDRKDLRCRVENGIVKACYPYWAIYSVAEWREVGWQFYPARLPKPKAAK